MNKHGDFGGPLCAEPYGDEVQSIVKRLLADSEHDKSLAFNNFTDPCPELTKKRLQTLKWFDFADKKKKLPSGPLHWPTGFPAPGHVILPEPNASGYDCDNFATSAWGLDRIDSVDVASKRVLIRVDFNAPQDKKDPSVTTNTQRIDAASPTIQYRLDQGCTSVVLASHLGRPDESAAEKYSLASVAKCLEDELERPVTILKGCAGPSVEAACANSFPGSVILLENVRFHAEEEEKGVDKDGNKFKADAEAVKVFRSSFAKLDDAFCSDAFGTAHRAHSSMMGDCFPGECFGFLVATELDAFAQVLDKAAKPVLAISGGAKVSDKIQLIKNTLSEDDHDAIVVVAVGNYQSDVCSCSSGRAVMSFNVGLHDLDDDVSYFSDFGSCLDAYTSREEYSDEVVNETEAMAVEVEAVDFPEVDADRKDATTLRDAVAEEVLVPVVGAPTTRGVFDRFPQSSGRMRLVSTPLWSLRPPMCPLWLIIGKAALKDEGERYADDRDAFAAQEERCSSWRRANTGGVVACGVQGPLVDGSGKLPGAGSAGDGHA